MSPIRLAAFAATALILPGTTALAATIRVPADQPTIAAGLAAAAAGDEVVVGCGDYAEQHLVVPSGVTLRSETGFAECVRLTSALYGYHLVRLDTVSDVLVRGFSFRSRMARAVVVYRSTNIRIEDCLFRECETRVEGLLDTTESEVTVSSCRFENNILRQLGASRQVDANGSVTLVDCSFAFTSACIGYPNIAVHFTGSGPHAIRSSRFDDIWGPCVVTSGSDVVVEDTSFRKGIALPYYAPGPVIGLANGGSLLLRNCVVDSAGWGDHGWAPYENNLCLESRSGGTLRLESCTVVGPRAYTAIVGSTDARVEVARSILAGSRAANVFQSTGGSLDLSCANVYASSGVVFGGSTPPDTQGVFSADPLFCDPVHGDYRLAADSPCLPGATPCGGLVGALGMGCGAVGVEPTSWGKIKNLYR